jgi:cysteinyl-tRNA synthetase
MIAMIKDLIAKEHAYEAEGHALFRVRSYAEYGTLSGRSVDDMIAGARVEVAPYKEDPMDFVLWKPSSDDQPGWDSPWGHGRPGWHIECSAMALDLLGDAFDIHGGGNDLTFPHHENEIAQSKCAGHGFANVWIHNEMLQVEGKKMSKSLGNFFTVRDLLEQGVAGEVIRLVFLMTHYRKPMDWTDAKRAEAQKMLTDWFDILRKHGYSPKTVAQLKASGDWAADIELMGVLGNDLNTPGALARMHVLAKARTSSGLVPLAHALETLGLVSDWAVLDDSASPRDEIPDWVAVVIDQLIAQRGAARASKDWGEADRLRDLLSTAGVQVTDVAGTASWSPGQDFDPSVLEALK